MQITNKPWSWRDQFLEGKKWRGTHKPLKFGSYVAFVRRNCTVGQIFVVTSHLCCLGVPRQRLADLPRFQNLKMQSFPQQQRSRCVVGIVRQCTKLFDCRRDAARREGVLKPGWKKYFASLWKSERDLLGAQNMDFMRLRNEPTLMMLLVEIPTEIIYRSEYLCWSGSVGMSKYQALTQERSPLLQSCVRVIMWGVCMPRHHLPRFDKLSGLDTRLASGLCAGRAQSTYFYSTEILAYVTPYDHISLYGPSPQPKKSGYGLWENWYLLFSCAFSLNLYLCRVSMQTALKSHPFVEKARKPQNWSSRGCDGLTPWSAGGGLMVPVPQ